MNDLLIVSDQAVFFDFIQTPFGKFQVAATKQGLTRIRFPHRRLTRADSKEIPPRVQKVLRASKRFLRYFFSRSGKVKQHERIPIDWNSVSAFDQRVLKVLRRIRPGETISYDGLARLCRAPRAARAVGNALHRNPIPVLIPCHRVVRKDHTLGGYGGGIRWKKLLLRLEQGSEDAS